MTSTIETEDVVERLRESAKAYRGMLHDAHADDCEKAADTIERLREENARYREAHEKIVDLKLAGDSISRAALNQQ